MWFLLIILLASPPGINRTTVLNTFATYKDCQPERDRIGFAMAESYPYENDFRIVCEFREVPPHLPSPLTPADQYGRLLDLVSWPYSEGMTSMVISIAVDQHSL